MSACDYWTDGAYCGAEPARRFLPGWRCAEHTPSALAGRPELPPPPAGSTLAALLARAGRAGAR